MHYIGGTFGIIYGDIMHYIGGHSALYRGYSALYRGTFGII